METISYSYRYYYYLINDNEKYEKKILKSKKMDNIKNIFCKLSDKWYVKPIIKYYEDLYIPEKIYRDIHYYNNENLFYILLKIKKNIKNISLIPNSCKNDNIFLSILLPDYLENSEKNKIFKSNIIKKNKNIFYNCKIIFN
jgi:hypothetical protein